MQLFTFADKSYLEILPGMPGSAQVLGVEGPASAGAEGPAAVGGPGYGGGGGYIPGDGAYMPTASRVISLCIQAHSLEALSIEHFTKVFLYYILVSFPIINQGDFPVITHTLKKRTADVTAEQILSCSASYRIGSRAPAEAYSLVS